jgi:hypothetical protein
MLRRSRAATAAVATVLATALVAVPETAQAQQSTVTDAAGDTFRPGLDFTSVTVRNADRAVVFTLRFVRDRPGEVIVNVKPRHGSRAIIVSRHRRSGPDKLLFVARDGQPCSGLSSDWSRRAATLQLRMPARCLNGGNYGAVRFWGLVEGPSSGGDVDYTSETPDGDIKFSEWVPRG